MAHDILRRVECDRAFASILLDDRARRFDDPRDVALLHEIVLGVLRRRAALDHGIAQVSTRPLDTLEMDVLLALRIGAYSLLHLDRVPAFAAVDRAVALAPGRGRGFVNAVLRRIAREGHGLLPNPPARGDLGALALYHSHPRWWVERLVARSGWDVAEELLTRGNEPAPAVLRANLRRGNGVALGERLAREGIETEPCRFVPEARRVGRGPWRESAALREGWAWVQDEAAQLVVAMLEGALGPLVADLCAAPGGKTLQLAERLERGGRIVAIDRRPTRLRRLRQRLARLGIDDVLPLVADSAGRLPPLRGPVREILVDAPCSGTGTLRRHPEIRWRLAPEALPALAAGQRALLETAARLAAPGSRVVYAVCSLEPEEGPEVIDGFLRAHPEFRIGDPSRGLGPHAAQLLDARGFLRTSPVHDGMDGFFGALLLR